MLHEIINDVRADVTIANVVAGTIMYIIIHSVITVIRLATNRSEREAAILLHYRQKHDTRITKCTVGLCSLI